MRKSLVSLLACIAVLFTVLTAHADITLTVTNPTNTTPNLLASYPSLSAALTDLNLVSSMTGPVIFTLDAGTSETAPPTGFVIGSASLNAVLSSTNTVTFVKAGGTVTINAGVGTATPGSASPDGMLRLNGADYITIDGITFTDGNVTNPATMEFGVALFKRAAGDGCNNNTIQNCTFNMQRINNATGTAPMIDGSVGILLINSVHGTATTALTPTNGGTLATNGTNSANRIYANAINSGNIGIGLSGFAASSGVGPNPTATSFLGDLGNDIGGTSLATGNTILNFGGGAATNPSAGIRANNQWSANISYNTLNNNNGSGVNHTTTLRGIYGQAGTSANVTINNNNVTVHGGGTTTQVAAIENVIGSTAAANTANINNNTITGDYLTATTGTFFGILSSSTSANIFLINNNVSNMSYSGAALAGSGTFYGIQNSGAATTVTARLNVVNNLTRTGTTGGTIIGLYLSGGTTQFANSNTTTNITHSGTGTGGIVYGIQVSGTTVTADTNSINNISNAKSTGTGAVYGLYNFGSPTNENYNYNLVNNINHSGTGIVYGIYTNTAAGVRTMSNNTVHTVTGAGTTVAGINIALSTVSCFKNKVYNISSSSTGSAIVTGLLITSGTTVNAYNNLVGDIKAPSAISTVVAPSVRGISVVSATATTSYNLYNNSVYLNASSVGANFSSCALFHTTNATATTGALTIRNNAFINLSAPSGTGVTAAYIRSSTTLTNYAAASNTNLFYGGPADATHLIFADGTNAVQTIGAFKTLVASREGNSVSESPTFLSTTASASNFLKVDSLVATQLESGGSTISSPAITNDFYNIARYPNAGYPENLSNPATSPDIGANEFGGIPVDMNPPNISYTAFTNSSLTDRVLTSTITDITGVPTTGPLQPRIYYRKNAGSYVSAQGSLQSGTGTNGVWNFTITAADLGGVVPGDVVGYFVIAQDLAGPYITSNPSAGLVATDVNTVTTPPTTPNTYTVLNVPMSGDFTVGSTLFRAVTGLNITFEERIRKVMKEIPIESDAPVSKNAPQDKKEHLIGEAYAPGTSTMVEVDQVYSVPMLDGKEYTGKVYHELTKAEKRQFNLSDNMLGIYLTLTAANADVTLRGVGATDCRLLLNDAAYNTGTGETFPIIIDATQQLPTSSSRLIIKPNTGVTTTISTSSTSGIIVSRAPYVVFDGTAEGNSGTRDLTIQNTSTAANTYVLGMFNNTAPRKADNNTVKYCNITGGQVVASTNAVFGIILNAAGGDFDNCVIDNNLVTSVRTAMQIAGVAGFTSDNVTVSNNVIGSTTDASSCFFQGILVAQADNTIITQNELIGQVLGNIVNGQTGTASGTIAGIVVSTGATNTKIRRNNIHDWNFAGITQGYGAKGIVYSNASNNVGTTEISNNLIYQIKGDSDNDSATSSTNMGYLVQGICIANNGTSLVQVYNNSVYLAGATLTDDFNGSAACLGISGGVGAGSMDVRNNLFRSSMTCADPSRGANLSIWVPTAVSNNIFAAINNNNYYSDGLNPLVGTLTTRRVTLANWQSASGQDALSLSGTIPFVSTTNLSIDATSSNAWYVSGLGYPLAAVTTDYTGSARSTTVATGSTDLGAYNVTPSSMPPTATESAAPAPSTTTTYTLAGKTLASITWGAGGTPPTSMALNYYSGTNLPNINPASFHVGNGYWDFTATGGSGYTYDVTLNYSPAEIGNINEFRMRLLKSNDGGSNYIQYLDSGQGAGQIDYNTTNKTITAFGLSSFSLFGLTDFDMPAPVELASFTANINKNNVDLNWSTVSEENNVGFDIERKLVSSTTWSKVGNVSGNGTSNEVHNYTFADRNVTTGKYNYRLKQIDYNGNFEYYQLSSFVDIGIPAKFDMSQNYPNPFNPTTKINYDLPFDSKVSIRLFDMTGKEVAQIVNATQTAGYYTAQFNGSNLASGVYFYNIIAEGGNAAKFVTTKKMVLVK